MPPKRRSTGPVSRSASQQSTLAFHGRSNKVTKATSTITGKDAKLKKSARISPSSKTKVDPAIHDSIVHTDLPAVSDPDISAPTTADVAILDQAAAEQKQLDAEDELALKVSDKQIKAYWKKKEGARKAPRVHQETLTLEEKVLREWDTKAEFGPCIGIARLKRWKRAHRLGLNPPIEVLAVLLKEQEADNLKAQRAYVDVLLSGRFIET